MELRSGFRLRRSCSKRKKIGHKKSGSGLRPPSSTQKKIEDSETTDYISELPDAILQHILSFLTMKDVVKTRVLSERWLTVWEAVPTLNFDHGLCPCTTIANFIDKTLRLYPGPKVEKLCIRLYYNHARSSQIDDWVRFATERKVEELFLNFHETYQLHESIYSNSSLRILHTMSCDFLKPSGYISWNSLKTLSIGSIKLRNEAIGTILSGSPNLEFLKLTSCSPCAEDNFQLTVSSSSLKELVVEYISETGPGSMEFRCSNVRSLSLIGNVGNTRIKMIHHSSLMEANLCYYSGPGFRATSDDLESHCNLLKEYPSNLDNVEKLTIGRYCLQVLSVSRLLSLSSSLPKLTSLTLNTRITNSVLPGIANLLGSSPHLEKLTVNMGKIKTQMQKLRMYMMPEYSPIVSYMKPEYSPIWEYSSVFIDGENYLKSMERNCRCLSINLKSIEITGLGQYSGFDPETVEVKFFCLLMEFLLKKAKVLEKMVIYAENSEFGKSSMSSGKQRTLWESIKLNQLILSYPRASPNAVVQFKNICT